MIPTRADSLSQKATTEFFSDFFNDFEQTPIGNQLARITNARAVTQSIKNLIMTSLGERFYQPYVGSDVRKLAFEMNDYISHSAIKLQIENTIENHEPRAVLIGVDVKGDNENSVTITIVYNLINSQDPISFNFILKRVR